jgi:hypothetical protein
MTALVEAAEPTPAAPVSGTPGGMVDEHAGRAIDDG